MVQWLGLRASSAGVACSIPGQGTKIPYVVQLGQKKKSVMLVCSLFSLCPSAEHFSSPVCPFATRLTAAKNSSYDSIIIYLTSALFLDILLLFFITY